MKKHNVWQMMLSAIKQNVLLSIILVITIAGAVIAGVIPPLILEKIVNRLTGNEQIGMGLIVLYVAMLAVAQIFDAGKEGLITVFGQKVTHVIRSAMSQKMSRLTTSYYVENETGTITSRFVNDVDTIENLFDSGVISMIADGCKVISILVVIFIKSKGLGILMIIVTPILMLLTIWVQKRMLSAQVKNRVAVGKANHHVPETVQSIRMIHTFHAQKYMERKYRKYLDEGYEAMEQSNFYDAIYSPVIITISAIMVSVMMVCAAMGGNVQQFFGMSVGTAVAVISYVSKVFEPLESIGMEIQNIQSAVAGIVRLNEFMNEEERPEVGKEGSFDKKQPAIAFKEVSFGYTKEQKILEKMNMEVATGENVTLVGRTGAGKSTAFKLIQGMYDTDAGRVEIYGIQATEISDQNRAKLIGYVEQSFHIIPGTVGEQISLKDTNIKEQQVKKALQIVDMLEAVENLEDGLQTKCVEGLFSQGQMQLLSIARAIVRNPEILLLDEITANLDSVTEQMVLTALREASKNRTVLSISHRVYETLGEEFQGRIVEIL